MVDEGQLHQDLPFEKLVNELGVQPDTSRHPIFQVLMILDSFGQSKLDELADMFEHYKGSRSYSAAKFDITLKLDDSQDELHGIFNYRTSLFKASTIDRYISTYQQLLVQFTAPGAQSKPIRSLNYLNEADFVQLDTFNATAVAYPENKTVISLFGEQVHKTPERIALVYEEETFSYRELNARVNRLAHYLSESGLVAPGDKVIVCMERTPELLTAVLAIMMAGAAYVPADPGYPAGRLAFMMTDTAAKLVLTDLDSCAKLSEAAPNDEITVLATDELLFRSELQRYSVPDGVTLPGGDSLAYVIYTSGTTGQPKGVMLSHNNLYNFLSCMGPGVDFDSGSSMLAVTNITFDIHCLEFYLPLVCGAKVILASATELADTALLKELLQRSCATHMQATPSRWQQIVSSGRFSAAPLKILTGGEALSEDLKEVLLRSGDVWNLYGPTETTVWSTLKKLEPGMHVTIGRPISNTQVYILDSNQRLQPLGVPGELCIGGAGLAKGYLNRPELTAEKFIPNPFRTGELIYRTGDMAKWNNFGDIEYLGRIDDQVKIRGYRIEPAEIAAVLRTVPGVADAVVLVNDDGGGDKELAAYLVGVADVSSLRGVLAQRLPAYMIPAYFVLLDAFPLTVNGKLDKKALPDPSGIAGDREFVAPRNETETRLAEIWKQVLGREQISVTDDFFDLGGHSLKATRLASQIQKEFAVRLGLKELFSHTVLEDQAALIHGSVVSAFLRIEPLPVQPDYVLSSAQRRLWVLSQFGEASVAYNVPGVYVFEGVLDTPALQASFNALIHRHEILRTVFREDPSGEVRQVVLPALDFRIHELDLRGVDDVEAFLRHELAFDAAAPFDLGAGPLLRAALYRTGEHLWVFRYTMHHIISDGWSMNIILAELQRLYSAFAAGSPDPIPPLRIQYKDYAAWQQHELRTGALAAQKEYWLRQLAGILTVLDLPGDHPRPPVKTYNGAALRYSIPAADTAAFKALLNAEGCTLFMGLLAAVNVLLFRYTGQQDLIVGSPIAGRGHIDLEDQVGFYLNTLALRTPVDGACSFRSLLQVVRAVTLGAYEHQLFPFDELIDVLELQRDMSRSPLFDVMVVLQDGETGTVEGEKIGEVLIKNYKHSFVQTSKLDLTFSFIEQGEGILATIEYNTDIYNSERIDRLAGHLSQLLSLMAASPDLPVLRGEYISPAEREQLLNAFNDTAVAYPENKTVISLFEEQVHKTPERIALVYEEETLTYRELNNKCNQLAHYLQKHAGLRAHARAGVLQGRSASSVIAMIAIMKLGWTYIPVDSKLPPARIRYIIEESGLAVLLTNKAGEELLADSTCNRLSDWETLVRTQESSNIGLTIALDEPSFIIYTSGSTGNPKGVEQTHRTLYNLILWDIHGAKLASNTRHLQFSSFSFDSSLHDIYYSLLTGSQVHIVSESLRNDFYELREYIITQRITTLSMPYAALKALFAEESAEEFSGHEINEIISTGEQLYVNGGLLAFLKAHPSVKLYNFYGPSETHVVTGICYSYQDVPIPEKSSLGKPVHNTYIYILDQGMNLCPVGVQGELYIGGWNLAKGYLNRPELTAEKFIPNPFRTGELIYRTGDMGRWNKDGDIEYLGRIDDQVKIRGYRIEPAEIAAVLRTVPGVADAVVLVNDDGGGDKELAAYLVGVADVNSLRGVLAQRLPAYMIPAYFVLLDAFPLTVNGKLDKKALPDPSGIAGDREFVAPRNETETRLAEIWKQVLGREQISVTDDFFDLGGHSLKAMRLIGQINKEFMIRINIKDIFISPTIEALSNIIMANDWINNSRDSKKENRNIIEL